ncbi:MAG: MFS transporter [Rhodocyclaceae bacterium]|jgi:UMF1 family MFS transporter|nr:MFS transporter [Rhodocyclaceae bacterium]
MSEAARSGPILLAGVRRREVWAWAMFDFANSGYTTVVITAIFNAYFVAVIAGNAAWATFAWTAALSVSYALVLLTAPFVGAHADLHGKKRWLALTAAGCILGTVGLATAGPGELALALAFLVFSNLCFSSGENLIAAFLPELARPEGLGRVSGWGWGLGYLGGLATLGACLAWISMAKGQGQGATEFVPACLLITAVFFAVASAPTFLFLRERRPAIAEQAAMASAASAFSRVLATLRHARHYRDMRRFMLCILFYQAGIQTVIALAAIYAQQAMGFSTEETIRLIFVVNVTAAIGALLFGRLQDRIGHVRALALTLFGWIAMTLLAWAGQSAGMFWLAANIAGLCLGASQSAGRALVGLLAPEGRHGEFFGLWGVAVKLSSILGPLTYGAVTWLTAGDHRLAILVTGGYFIVGLAILAGVDVERGRRAAMAE